MFLEQCPIRPKIPEESFGTLKFLTSHLCSMLFYIPLPPSSSHHVILYHPSPLINVSCYSIFPFSPHQCIMLFHIPLPPSSMHHIIVYPPSPFIIASCYSISPFPPHQCIMLFYIPLPPSTMLPLGEKNIIFLQHCYGGTGGLFKERVLWL